MNDKTYLELTNEEVDRRRALTPKEEVAISAFIKAAKDLPKSLCIELDYSCLVISKRITRGSATQVAIVRKKSLVF